MEGTKSEPKNLKIVHLVFSFASGGIENLLVDVMNGWDSDDRLLLCIINNVKNEQLLAKIKAGENRQVICLGRKPKGEKLPYLLKLERILRRFRPDIIHCHSNDAFLFSLPLRFFHINAKYVLTIHSTRRYAAFGTLDCLMHRLFLSQIFAISKSVQREIEETNPGFRRVRLVYNGLELEKFENRKKRPNKKETNRCKIILCVARLNPSHKGQDILIRALGILADKRQDFLCIFAGSPPAGRPEIFEHLKQLGEEMGVEDRICFLGDRNDIPELLAGADLFVLPSRYEGFGIALIEAMAAGVPVLASDVDGIREIVGDNEYGCLFQTENEKELAKKIDVLLDADAGEMTERARVHVRDCFSIEKMTRTMKKLYTGE